MLKQFLLIAAIWSSAIAGSQSLSMTDLVNLCNKNKWQDVNQYLVAKGWTYYSSRKGDDLNYNTITWSFQKDYYTDKAKGWFYLYTYDGLLNKISYTVFNKQSYNKISTSITAAGFKLIDSEIEDDEVISDFENSKYKLRISFERRERDDWDDASLTGYNVSMIKKAGIYDTDNGKKYEYYDDGTVKIEYTLQNGNLNGSIISYHENGEKSKTGYYKANKKEGSFKEYFETGKLFMEYFMANDILNGPYKIYTEYGKLSETGTYKNGNKHGLIIDYNEFGEKQAEYHMLDGMKDGYFKTFENGKLTIEENYSADSKNGPYIEYFYPEDNDSIVIINAGQFLNDNKNGIWKLIYRTKSDDKTITFHTYKNGTKNGKFQDFAGDSIIVGSYKNEELDGSYKIYIDPLHKLFGAPFRPDIENLKLVLEGNYKEGIETGYWQYFDLNGLIIEEGQYENGEKYGEWKYYHSSLFLNEAQKEQFANKPYLIEHYKNGKLNGKKTQSSIMYMDEFPCSDEDPTKSSLDTCSRIVFEKFLETSFYKNGVLDGAYEYKDSNNSITSKGYFKNGLKDGEWTYKIVDELPSGRILTYYTKGFFKNDKYEGKWINFDENTHMFLSEHYKDGALFGESTDWDIMGKPKETRIFNDGSLESVTIYDIAGMEKITTYFIKTYSEQKLYCRKIDYQTNITISTDYYIELGVDLNPYVLPFLFNQAKNNEIGEKTAFLDGHYNKTLKNDQPLISGNYLLDKKIGTWTFYDYDHTAKVEIIYSNDQPIKEQYLKLDGGLYSGIFYYFDDANNIKEERKIKNGYRQGKTTFIDLSTGKTIKTVNYKDGVPKT